MKTFIFGIVVMLCMQTHAVQKSRLDCFCNKKSCEDKLAELRKEAATFFTEFEQEHDHAVADLLDINGDAYYLISILDSWVEADYGLQIDVASLSCILRTGLNNFNARLNVIKPIISHLKTETVTLVDKADKFRRDEDYLICKQGTLMGCEDDLNKLRCDLLEFIKDLNKYAQDAKPDLEGLDTAVNYLDNIAKKLDSDYNPTCDADGNIDQATNLKLNIKDIYFEFRKWTDVGMQNITDIAGICQDLADDIDTWNSRLA